MSVKCLKGNMLRETGLTVLSFQNNSPVLFTTHPLRASSHSFRKLGGNFCWAPEGEPVLWWGVLPSSPFLSSPLLYFLSHPPGPQHTQSRIRVQLSTLRWALCTRRFNERGSKRVCVFHPSLGIRGCGLRIVLLTHDGLNL